VVAEDGLEVEHGYAERPDATAETDSGTLAALVYEGRPLAEALRSGDVKIEGDESAVERFLSLFPCPSLPNLPFNRQRGSGMPLLKTVRKVRTDTRPGYHRVRKSGLK
jgi:hypothetical protein